MKDARASLRDPFAKKLATVVGVRRIVRWIKATETDASTADWRSV